MKFIAKAQGEVTVPAKLPLILEASYTLAENLYVLKRLPPDALTGIVFNQIDTEKPINLASLDGLDGLASVVLHHCPVSDTQLSKLSLLKNLEVIEAWASGINGTCFKDFQRLHKLIEIRAGSNRLDPSAFVALGHMPQIRYLKLHASHVDDAALAEIAKIRDLAEIDIANNPDITVKGLKCLNHCKKLITIRVTRCKLSGNDLLVLRDLKLRWLVISKTNVTAKDAAALHAAFPQLHIVSDDH